MISAHPESTVDKWLREDLMVNPTLRNIFRTERVTDQTGQEHKFMDGVNPIEGKHLCVTVWRSLLYSLLRSGTTL